jgi:hypothetical protein
MSQFTQTSTFQGYLKTIKQGDVLKYAASLMGYDAESNTLLGINSNLENNVATSILRYIDHRCREAWEFWDWTEMLIDDQRAFANAYNPISTYTTGTIVFYWGTTNATGSLTYYQASQNVPANQEPDISPSYWTSMSLSNTSLPLPLTVPTYGQTNPSGGLYPEIGTILGVYSNDPYQNQVPVPVPWTRSAQGVQVFPQYTTWAQTPIVLAGGAISYPYVNLNTVFILHRQPYPGFATSIWANGNSYTVGNLVFYLTDTYQCIQNTSSATPGNNSFWTLVPFPYILSEFVKEAVYADMLREDGQQEKAAMILGDKWGGTGAYRFLVAEADKQTLQQGLTQRYSVIVSGGGF